MGMFHIGAFVFHNQIKERFDGRVLLLLHQGRPQKRSPSLSSKENISCQCYYIMGS
jgi:hypothetical protein